jgi:hypothetical protein
MPTDEAIPSTLFFTQAVARLMVSLFSTSLTKPPAATWAWCNDVVGSQGARSEICRTRAGSSRSGVEVAQAYRDATISTGCALETFADGSPVWVTCQPRWTMALAPVNIRAVKSKNMTNLIIIFLPTGSKNPSTLINTQASSSGLTAST